MMLIAKLESLVKRLEAMKEVPPIEFDDLKTQLDDIENNILPQLEKGYRSYSNDVYELGMPNIESEENLEQMMDLFCHADALLFQIREKYGVECSEKHDEQLDEDCSHHIIGHDNNERNEGDERYEIVLHKIAESALKTIGYEYDEKSIGMMEVVLIGISTGESDDAIVGRAFSQMVLSGFFVAREDIQKICEMTRDNCKKQLFGLQIAYGSLDAYHCSAEEALTQIQMFL